MQEEDSDNTYNSTDNLKLQAKDNEEQEELDQEHNQLPSTIFFGVRGEQMREGEAPSYFNPIEAATLVGLVEGLLNECKGPGGGSRITEDDIGVIATYRKQVQKIRLLLRAKGLGGIRVGTVDDLQGQEERIVFISTVLSKPETLPKPSLLGDRDMHLGFWSNPHRFNVAVTRAKALLVVLGHPIVLIEDPNWRELLRFCAVRQTFRGAGSSAIANMLYGDQQRNQHHGDHVSQLDVAGEDADMSSVVQQIAELSLLGLGHKAHMFPESFEDIYDAYNEEVQWRVAL